MKYHISKDILLLRFVVGRVLSISVYDLENGRMPRRQKYLIKIWKILKSKTDSDVNMKQDLFEFDFELHLSDGFVKQKKPLH